MQKQRKELFNNLVPNQIGGYIFKNPLLLEQAFTRKTYTEENGGQNNEVLEYIGDKVLDICVVRYLINRYGTDFHKHDNVSAQFRPSVNPKEFESVLNEGELSKLKQRMIEKKALAARIDDLDLAQFLKMGKGDIAKNISDEPSVKEDLFEAIIGAVTIDSNWDFEKLQQVIEIMLCPDSFIENQEEADYVGFIYEWVAARANGVPYFKYFDSGVSRHWYCQEENVIYSEPKEAYNISRCNYACQVKIRDDLPVFESYGSSKNEARKEACKAAYEYLEEHGHLFGIKDEIENPNLNDSINQLEILARRDYFSIPTYNFQESHDKNGNPVWSVECHIKEMLHSFTAVDSSKKYAKKHAAYQMLLYVLENYEENMERLKVKE